jgi:glycosyltransferase involved in cell wall biosynthesis
LSNLLPGKGYLELFDAYSQLAPELRSSIVLDFAGAFESPKQKAEFLERIRPHPHIRYHGTVAGDAKRRLFHDAHVFCLPTYYPYEGQPISILEAYASGCAVITTDHSGIRDIFEAPNNGYEVAKRSSTDLAAALEAAANDREALRTIGRFNRRVADTNYRSAHYNARLLEIVDGVLQGGRT